MSYARAADSWILEGVLTTVSPEPAGAALSERVNIAPMGPIVDAACSRLVLRPFKTSTTYQNLKATGEGVFHVTDDALLIARAAVGRVRPGDDGAATRPAEHVTGLVMTDACRYHEIKVRELDDLDDRTTIVADVVHTGRLRDFFGFNRARHAVLEAAILATRLHLTGREPVAAELDKLRVLVEKTGGPREHQAMDELTRYVQSWRPQQND